MIWQALERASMASLSTYLTLTLIGILLYSLLGYLRNVLLAMRMPGPPALPLIGNCLIATERNMLDNRAVKTARDHGGVARFWLSIIPFFVVFDPEYLQTILSSRKHTEKSFFYKLLHNFLGDGLITSSGEKWISHRKYIQPIFHLSILEKFVETFADSAQCLRDKLSRAPEVLNITHFVNDCVLDILNEAVLGVPIAGKGENMENSPFRQGKVVVQDRVSRPWLLFSWIYKFTDSASEELQQKKNLDDFTMRMIRKRREELENGGFSGRKSLLDFMIEISKAQPDFTEQDIVDEACTFMLAGQDSVGASLAFALFLLAQNPSQQQKCIEEIDAIFNGDDDKAPTMNDLREMRYLEMCIKEALRLYPAVPLISRRLGEDVKCGKFILPAGAQIFILPYATHRLEHIYPEPEKFIPERFSQENVEKRNPYAFLPFSAGPRKCIGDKFALIEMKTIISKILRNFRLHAVEGKTTFEPVFRITLRASGGLWVQLEPRNNNN